MLKKTKKIKKQPKAARFVDKENIKEVQPLHKKETKEDKKPIKIKLKKLQSKDLSKEILDYIAKQKKKQTYGSVLEHFRTNYEIDDGVDKMVPLVLTKLENKGVLQLDQKRQYQLYKDQFKLKKQEWIQECEIPITE